MSYQIKVRTIDGNFLVFTKVEEYSVENNMVSFIDSKTGLEKNFSNDRTDIEEER